MATIYYICGGRSFLKRSPGRKISQIVRVWKEAGHEVILFCGGDLEGIVQAPVYGAQEHHDKWYRRSNICAPLRHSLSEYRDIINDRRMLSAILDSSRDMAPDIIWERSSRLHDAGLVAAERLGVPYILEWKDNLVSYRCSFFRRLALAKERNKNRKATGIVVESTVLNDHLVAEGIVPDKIMVAINAVDVREFQRERTKGCAYRKSIGAKDDEILVGYLGSYAFYHDTVRLVRAAEIIKSRVTNIRVLMVGAGQQYREARSMAQKLEIFDNVVLMRPSVPPPTVPDVLSALDIAVLPGSTDIICPIKVQEYMAAGLPAIAPDYECNREIINDGVNGMLFAPGNAASLADKIMILAKDHEFRARMSAEARKTASEKFTWENTWGNALHRALANAAASKLGRSNC